MTDLRKAAEQALEALESLDCGDTYKTHNAASALRQALAQPVDLAKVGEVGVWGQETFTLDRGCYERGCVAYDERDGDGVTINVDANSGKFDSIGKRDSSSWVKEKNSA